MIFIDPLPCEAGHQFMPLPRGALEFPGSLMALPNELSAFGKAFSCFGFRISRLLRFCPFAIAERPFDKSEIVSGLQVDRLEIVLRHYPFMTFVVIANAVLGRARIGRHRAGDMVDFRVPGRIQANSLAHREKMRCGIVPYWTDISMDEGCHAHDRL
ncbi:hypothetical protein [Pseudaminobacter sp. NGMCC 1.201702]|uniref:hypothetical protein n=1 Tax=Pseudaminobacter sp. NGMCC 1.201702 TaxID=3391825 RepID=UPI0039EEA482